jgi:NAD-dependent deacetylase sirtuin 5
MAMSDEERIKLFRAELNKAQHVLVLTGAGVSAESGVPTFRGSGPIWRGMHWEQIAQNLSHPDGWARDPVEVWAFNNYRRRLIAQAAPNPGHLALVELESRLKQQGKRFHLFTQNIDGLHERAGSRSITRLHGSLWRLRCSTCGKTVKNHDVPITPAFEGADDPSPEASREDISRDDLPKCDDDGGLMRPDVVWFGESLAEADLQAVQEHVTGCDLAMIVGTAASVYPAAAIGPSAKQLGATLVEVNPQASAISELADLIFRRPAGEILPKMLE